MIRVGLVGCGFMGTMHANVYSVIPNAELVAVADIKPERSAKLTEKFPVPSYGSLSEMLATQEIDVVDICLPTYLHKDATIEAAKAGKHVLCEKPMAINLEDADAMTAAVKEAGVKFMIGHCIRFWPEYAYLKQVVTSGELGKLLHINFTRFGEFPHWSEDNWLGDEAKAGGGVLDMHIHDSDFVLYLLGEPESSETWGTLDNTGPAFVYTTMQYPGCVAHIEGGWNFPTKTPFKMAFRASFENGAILMDGGPMTVYRPGQEPEVPTFKSVEVAGGGNISSLGGYYKEIEYFLNCIEQNKDPEIVTAETSRQSLAFTLEEIAKIKSRNA
jgi:predicted dehydrogenase